MTPTHREPLCPACELFRLGPTPHWHASKYVLASITRLAPILSATKGSFGGTCR